MKIFITGGAGLVGQNLILHLKENNISNIVAVDKHPINTKILKKLHPEISVYEEDLSEQGKWMNELDSNTVLILSHAQIGGIYYEEFVKNNILATKAVLKVAKEKGVSRLIHISISAVNSTISDFYSTTKKEQENLVIQSGIPCIILRPTLLFGWFDRKHLGFLARFMKKSPIFPIPGNGKFIRQPLYVRDLCKIILRCLQMDFENQVYTISGREEIYYCDLIKKIREIIHARSRIIYLPYPLFSFLLKLYSLWDKNPPFTTMQLRALTANERFELIPWWEIFEVFPTPLDMALKESFTHPVYSKIELSF